MKIVLLFRFFLLALSLLGYILLFSKWVQVEYAISFTIAAITSCLFFSGILNLLPEIAALLLIGGLICFVRESQKKARHRVSIPFSCIFLIICFGWLFYILYGSKYAEQDVFEHWGAVVKILINNQSFPNYLDKYLPHISYPPGTACWIYYWLFISGTRAESVQMFAQNSMFLAIAVSLFPLCKNMTGKILTAFAIITLLICNQNLFSIQVDSILAVIFISVISFGVYYREKIKEKMGWLIVLCLFLTTIKNSGILLVILILAFLFPWLRWRKTGLIAGTAGITIVLWSKHTQLLFPNASTAKYAISIENYRNVLSEKSHEDIVQIWRLFWNRETSHNIYIYLLILAVLIISLCFIIRTEERFLISKLSIYSIACYWMHQAGLLCTYMISMPRKEAVRLSWYSRYQKTALMIFAGILLIAVLLLLNVLKRKTGKSIALSLICGLLFVAGIAPNPQYLKRQNSQMLKDRDYFDQLISQCHIPDKARIMTFTDTGEDPHNYYNALSRYYFAPDRIMHENPQTVSSWNQVDYVLVLTESEDVKRFITESSIPEHTIIVMR